MENIDTRVYWLNLGVKKQLEWSLATFGRRSPNAHAVLNVSHLEGRQLGAATYRV